MSVPSSGPIPPRSVAVRGAAGELACRIAGDPDAAALPVLFAHPINLQGACWTEVVASLAPPSRFCVLPDVRGHGDSHSAGPFGIEHWVEDLVTVLDALSVERAHVVGGSLGGAMAVYLAATRPERVASIACVGSALAVARAEGDPSPIEAFHALGPQRVFEERLPASSLAPDASPAVIQRTLELANPNDADTVSAVWTAAANTDVRRQAAEVRCPATVISGQLDLTFPPAGPGRELADALGVELVTMPGVAHLPMLEAPQELVRLLDAHLTRAEAAS